VCLVVLGKHVPRFEFLDVLFGNKPVLLPHQQLYQRLLAGDPVEATERAETFVADSDLVTFYETVAIPALGVGELDRARGVMTGDRRRRVADSALTLVDNLEDYADQEQDVAEQPDPPAEEAEQADASAKMTKLPDGSGGVVLCAGGRGKLDDAAAAMLAQVLIAQGATARPVDHPALEPARIRNLDLSDVDTVVIGYLNADSAVHARYVVRRLKRARSSPRIGVVFWSPAEDALSDIKLAATIGCDFVAHTLRDGVIGALSGPLAAKALPTKAAPAKTAPAKTAPAKTAPARIAAPKTAAPKDAAPKTAAPKDAAPKDPAPKATRVARKRTAPITA
jgi:hypothetical protein